jgi:hypothetical protein
MEAVMNTSIPCVKTLIGLTVGAVIDAALVDEAENVSFIYTDNMLVIWEKYETTEDCFAFRYAEGNQLQYLGRQPLDTLLSSLEVHHA